MSTSVIEPGTRLAGRYRLEERVHRSGGSTLWRATDEILARAVAVRTFEPDFELIIEVVMAARSASRLTDPRLTQVFDADNSGEFAYVVSEWVVGQTLEDMVATGGPMESGRAATLLGEACDAIAAAHTAGLAHLRLTPRDLLWTTGNTVKILGLGVDAALSGTTVTNPGPGDTEGLAHLLYLALTGHWPGSAPCRLPAAPTDDGLPYQPRRLRPGVPQTLDQIVCRCLGRPGQETPITSPAKLAEALSGVPRLPLPLFAGYPQGSPPSVVPRPASGGPERTRAMPTPPPSAAPPPSPPPAPPRPASIASHRQPPPGGNALDRIGRGPLIGVAAGVAVLVIGIIGWQLASGDGGTAPKTGTKSSAAPQTTKKADAKLTVQSVTGLDEPNPAQPGHGDTSVGRSTAAVTDGRSSTTWASETYTGSDFGRYVKGVGVRLDMGRSVKVTRVRVALAGRGGATLELRLGEAEGLTPGGLRLADKESAAAGTVELRNTKGTTGRYVLVWFATPAPAGFKAQISEVTVYGQPG